MASVKVFEYQAVSDHHYKQGFADRRKYYDGEKPFCFNMNKDSIELANSMGNKTSHSSSQKELAKKRIITKKTLESNSTNTIWLPDAEKADGIGRCSTPTHVPV